MDFYYPLPSDPSCLWGGAPGSEDNSLSNMMYLHGYFSDQQPPMQGLSAITQDPLTFHPDGMEQDPIPGSSFPTEEMVPDQIQDYIMFPPSESYGGLPGIAEPAIQTCIAPSEISSALKRTSISAPSMIPSYDDPGYYAPMPAPLALGTSQPVFRLMGWPGEGDLGESHLNNGKGKQRAHETPRSENVGGYSAFPQSSPSRGVSNRQYHASPPHPSTPFSSSPSGSPTAPPYCSPITTSPISTLATEISPPPPSLSPAAAPSGGTESVKKTVRSRKQPTAKKGSAAVALAKLIIKNKKSLTSPYGGFVPYPPELASGSDVLTNGGDGATVEVRPGRTRRNGHIPQPVIVPGLHRNTRGRKVPTASEADKNRSFVCGVSVCRMAFGRAEHLKRHESSTHTLKKPFECPQAGCGKRFSRRDNLAQHARTHRSNSPAS